MSFILDALRKSDARRQQSAAPGINSPEPPRPSRPRRFRRWPLLALLVLFVGAAASVALLRPQWLPDAWMGESPELAESGRGPSTDSGTEPSDVQAEDAAAIRERMVQQHGSESGTDRRRMPPQPSAEDANVGSATTGSSAPDGNAARRVPVPASPDRVVRRQAQPERESEPVKSSEATAELERRMAEEAARRRQARAESIDEEPGDRTVTEPGGPAGRDTREGMDRRRETPPAPAEAVAEFVRVWELPLSVRRNLPELDLSIHVFSPEASQRFVLINGERYTTGDTIGEARIVDIRREGAVVDFRSHRFLLEPR